MTKPNFFAFTGAPGAGKTTLINALADRGIYHIKETAREVIKSRLNVNLPPRPDPATFARMLYEKDLENFETNLSRTETLLFDRSFVDSAWMMKEADAAGFKTKKAVLYSHRFNTSVFIAPPYREIYTADEERDQTFEDAVVVYNKLYYWYEACDYELIVLPKVSVEERVNFVLDKIYFLQND